MRTLVSIFLAGFNIAAVTAMDQEQTPGMIYQGSGDTAMTGKMVFGGGGRWLATLPQVPAEPLTIRIIDVSTGRLIRSITDAQRQPIRQMTADPVRDALAIGLADGAVAMIDVPSGKQIWRSAPTTTKDSTLPIAAQFSPSGITDLHFSPDGAKLIGVLTTSTQARLLRLPKLDRTIYTWDVEHGNTIETKPLPNGAPLGGWLSRDGRWRLEPGAVKGAKKEALVTRITDVATGQSVGPPLMGFVYDAHAGVRRAVMASMSGGICLVDVATGKEIPIGISGAYKAAFSPNGGAVVLLGTGFGWRLIDSATGQVRFAGGESLPMTNGEIIFSPDGARFAVALFAPIIVEISDPSHYRQLSSDETPIVRSDLTNTEDYRKTLRSFGGKTETAPSASFTTDGRWLVARSADGQLDFFDTATGNRLPFRIPTDRIPLESGQRQPPLFMSANGRYVYIRSETKQEEQTIQTTVKVPKMFYRKGTEVVDRKLMQGAFTTQTVDTMTGQVVRTTKFQNVACVSSGGEFAVEYTTTSKGSPIATLKSTEGAIADLAEQKVDLSAGCSISNDGKYIVVVGAGNKPSTVPVELEGLIRDSMYGEGFSHKRTDLQIYDVTSHRITASLQDSSGKPAKFPFSASQVSWTVDNRYILGGGGSDMVVNHGPLRVFEAATGRQLREFPDSKDLRSLEITPDGQAIVVASARGQLSSLANLTPTFGVDVCDANSGKTLYSLRDASNEPGALAFGPNSKVIVGPDLDGALSIWRRSDGALLGKLRALQEGEWLVHTPGGLFDGSPRAWSLISWHDSDRSLDPAAGEIYFNEFYTPGLLADLLDGRQPKAARTITSIDRRQPTITITAAENLEGGASIRITVTEAAASVSAAKGSGVRDLRLFRNGQLIKAWRGNLQLDRDGHVSVETTAKLTAGPNRFSAYAFNSDNIKSADAEAVVTRPGGPAPGVAYVLTIGVNEYANPEFNLKYAAPDADAVAAGLIERQKGLNQFSEIRSIDLRNGQATRANIMLALKRLAGEDSGPLPADAPPGLREVRAIEPEDTLILYFAGHGIASGDRFYLVPHDLGFSGPRSEIRANISEILKHGISDQDLERALEPIDARHMVLIIDACQSGQALESDDDRRGPMNSRGLAQLAWEKGISILAASQAYQAALESSQFGHGYLTFALTQEGLRTPVADSAPADGVITETEWLEYAARRVPQLQIEALEKAREDGRKLTLEIVTDNAASARLQSPRLFTRRDSPGAPLIVAKYK